MNETAFTALVVDDEALARAVVREHLAAHPEIQVLGECADGFEAVRLATELKPDLLFLDIQMPKLNGFEVLELLSPRPSVVFITAHDQHALKAFDVHAVDYLLKPFSEERFEEALRRAKERRSALVPEELSKAARGGRPLERIVVKDGTRVTVVPLSAIDYIQAQDDYVLLKTRERSHLKAQTMASLEENLDPRRFVRIHRSYLIPLDRLQRLEQGPSERWLALLADGSKLPVSRSGHARLKELLGEG